MLENLGIAKTYRAHVIRRFRIADGDQGTVDTLKLMSDVIKYGANDYYVRRWAEEIVRGIRDQVQQTHAIVRFLYEHTTYTRDILGTEFIKSAEVSLQLLEAGGHPQLDCDDYSVLTGALLMSIGIPVALRATAYGGKPEFSHVYNMVKLQGKWYPLDMTLPHGVGFEASGAGRKLDLEVK